MELLNGQAVVEPLRNTRSRRALLVELVGPAGVGKSTLASGLKAWHSEPCAAFGLWGLPRSHLIVSALVLLPALLRALLAGGQFRRAEIAQLVRLGALRRAVLLAERRGARLIVLDEGPVFGLTWLDLCHASNGDTQRVALRTAALHEWAHLLGAVVYLDAEDPVLVQRIRTRDKPHPVKHQPDEEIYGFTARFRHAFDDVIARVTSVAPVRVLDMRTDRRAAAELTAQVGSALEALHAR
jgi:thymidylate kinase